MLPKFAFPAWYFWALFSLTHLCTFCAQQLSVWPAPEPVKISLEALSVSFWRLSLTGALGQESFQGPESLAVQDSSLVGFKASR